MTIPFYILLSIVITPTLRKRLDEKFKHGAANTAFLTESITGIGTVKAQAIEPQMQRNLESNLSSYVTASFRSENVNNVANQVAGLINKLMTLGILWLGAHLVIDGMITVGELIAFNMLAGRVSGPILKLVQLWQDFQQAGISLARLGDILNTPKESGADLSKSILNNFKGKIQFDAVNFKYSPNSAPILKNLHLEIKPGQVIGFVGKSGCGKSTISKLIQRLYIPESGRVLVDDVELSLIDTNWLRQKIGVVSQENFLFNRSIRENIALVNPSATLESIVKCAKLAGAHDFITQFPEAYNTVVGEQGANLSGGQRQRIAIARALLTDPKILILDEATSALDYESEQLIQNNMSKICRGRTVLMIAHRLSTLRICDKIVVMDQGAISEQGSHSELIESGGYYAKLINMQNINSNRQAVRKNPPFVIKRRTKTDVESN